VFSDGSLVPFLFLKKREYEEGPAGSIDFLFQILILIISKLCYLGEGLRNDVLCCLADPNLKLKCP